MHRFDFCSVIGNKSLIFNYKTFIFLLFICCMFSGNYARKVYADTYADVQICIDSNPLTQQEVLNGCYIWQEEITEANRTIVRVWKRCAPYDAVDYVKLVKISEVETGFYCDFPGTPGKTITKYHANRVKKYCSNRPDYVTYAGTRDCCYYSDDDLCTTGEEIEYDLDCTTNDTLLCTVEVCNTANTEVCDGYDNDCNGGTPDGSGETGYNEPCDGADTDKCQEGVMICNGASLVCNDNTSNNLELCDGEDNDCNAATADGADEVWLNEPCDGEGDTDKCKEGNAICLYGNRVCNDYTGNNERNCRSEDDNDCNGIPDNKEAKCKNEICIHSKADISTGRYTHSQVLFNGASLYYDSFGAFTSTVAPGWRLGYNITLQEQPDGSVIITEGDSQQRAYVLGLDGYVSGEGDDSTLTDNGDGTWDMIAVSGAVSHFGSDGKLLSITARTGNTVLMNYSSGLLVGVTDPTEINPVTITYVNGKVDRLIDPSGNTYDLNYYPDGTLQEVIYPLPASYSLDVPQPDGSLQSVTYPEVGTPNPKWTYTYENGLLKSKTDTLGKTTTYNFVNGKIESSTITTDYGDRALYLNFGNYTGDTRETVKTAIDGGDWKYRFNASSGKITEEEDPEGGITRYEYEGDLVKHIFSPDNQRESIYRYDGNNNLLVAVEKELVGAMRAYSTNYTYNSFGLLSTTTTPLEGAFDVSGPVNSVTTTYRYDDKGQTTYIGDSLGRETFIQYTTIGTEKHVTTTVLGKATTMVYDENDRLLSATAPSSVTGVNSVTHYTYGVYGNMSTVTDTLGRVTRYKYDSLGRMVQVIGPNENSENRTTYVYNTDGSIDSVIDAEGNKTSYTYTNLGQQKAIINALNQATFMSYSAAGCGSCSGGVDKLTRVTDANDKATTYTYDKIGRLLDQIVYDKNGASPVTEKSFSYNANRYEYTKTDARGIALTYVNDYMGRLIEKKVDGVVVETYTYYLNGWLHTASKDGLTYTYTYYAEGNIRTVADGTRTITYTYDAAGNRSSMTVSGLSEAVSVGYSYTDAYQPDTIMATGAGTFDFDYNVDGSRKSLDYPNSVFTNYSYDASGRLVSIANGLANSSYSHYPSGNRKSHTKDDGTVVSYEYDDLYRLKFAGYSSAAGKLAQFENYTYDAIGNRMAHDKVIFSIYSTQQDQIGISSYDYDYENRLVRVKRAFSNSSTVVNYDYDVFGRRIGRTVSTDGVETSRVSYFYDNEDIIAELDGAGNILKVFVHGPGIDEPLAVKDVASGNWYYYHADGLGSVLKLTDASGSPVAGYSFGYDAFGNLVKGSLDKNYSYTGREWDKEAGLYYYRARFYDPEVGRFISKDPIGFDGGDVNLYSYVQQNPVNWVDPWGLFMTKWWGPTNPSLNTIVCDRNGGIVPQLGNIGNAKQTKCLSNCVRQHELSHAADALKADPNICRGKKKGVQLLFSSRSEQRSSEIAASNVEIKCLKKELESCGCDCENIIKARIKQMEGFRDSFK